MQPTQLSEIRIEWIDLCDSRETDCFGSAVHPGSDQARQSPSDVTPVANGNGAPTPPPYDFQAPIVNLKRPSLV